MSLRHLLPAVYRNALTLGFLLECPLPPGVEAGDLVSVKFGIGLITNLTKKETYQAIAFPPFIQNIIAAGGLLPSLRQERRRDNRQWNIKLQ